MDIQLGDWIRFWNNGRIMMDEIIYIKKDIMYPYAIQYITQSAITSDHWILEIRRKREEINS